MARPAQTAHVHEALSSSATPLSAAASDQLCDVPCDMALPACIPPQSFGPSLSAGDLLASNDGDSPNSQDAAAAGQTDDWDDLTPFLVQRLGLPSWMQDRPDLVLERFEAILLETEERREHLAKLDQQIEIMEREAEFKRSEARRLEELADAQMEEGRVMRQKMRRMQAAQPARDAEAVAQMMEIRNLELQLQANKIAAAKRAAKFERDFARLTTELESLQSQYHVQHPVTQEDGVSSSTVDSTVPAEASTTDGMHTNSTMPMD